MFSLELIKHVSPDKSIICDQANVDPFNVSSYDLQAQACQ